MQKFDKQGFINYMYEQFPTVFEKSFTRELLDNLIEMAVKRFGHSKYATSYFLSDILPVVTNTGELKAMKYNVKHTMKMVTLKV